MHRNTGFFESGKRVGESDHTRGFAWTSKPGEWRVFECAKHNAPRVLSRDESRRRHGVEVIESPRFLLEIFDGVMLSLTLDLAYVEVFTVNIPLEHKPLADRQVES